MSRSLLHDWEYKIDKCCKENLPVEMKRIAEDIYNTAYARGKNRAVDVLDNVRAEIENYDNFIICANGQKGIHIDKALEIIDKYKGSEEK